MDSGDHNEGEKHHLRNFIAMRVKFFSRILSSTLWQKLSRKLISWSQLMIQSKWWEVGRIIPYDFVMYDLYFCHFKTYEILHSVLRHPVNIGNAKSNVACVHAIMKNYCHNLQKRTNFFLLSVEKSDFYPYHLKNSIPHYKLDLLVSIF